MPVAYSKGIESSLVAGEWEGHRHSKFLFKKFLIPARNITWNRWFPLINRVLISWGLDPPLLYWQSFQVNTGNAYKLPVTAIMLYFSSASSGNFVISGVFRTPNRNFSDKIYLRKDYSNYLKYADSTRIQAFLYI